MLRCAFTSAHSIGGTQGEAVDIRAIERRRIDRRDNVGREHARERRSQRQEYRLERRAIDTGFEPPARLLGRDDFKELFLPCRAPHCIENSRAATALFRLYGHSLTATSVPAPNPSLAAGTTIQPSLRVSAVNDK